ncbi:plasma kallikrein-like isoform X2 [Plodia interpunctella]|uniref:plasma kallikrein-like isoform X2 n=1 Tax=Plodia interpunctella TaxID=58824 RepID=UPI0023675294|nr:plasma kallikrein-like isoform X2 [Plodia interpunctella]
MFKNFLSTIALVIISCEVSSVSCNECNLANPKLQEGILGEVPHFPWLGILRIAVPQEDKTVIAATGVVLITPSYVLVNADDVAKIPMWKLKKDAKVYFIPEYKKPWIYKAQDVILHPEYEFATYNTLALLELVVNSEWDEEEHDALDPICWPGKSFNTSNELYTVGYTDERLLLEKVLYKGQYIAKDMCSEYYKRISFQRDKMQEPVQYVCTATSSKQDCRWDNGMLLISNATGRWTLVGFGSAGPGCSAPARFLDISRYIDWVQSATTQPEAYGDYGGHNDDVADQN